MGLSVVLDPNSVWQLLLYWQQKYFFFSFYDRIVWGNYPFNFLQTHHKSHQSILGHNMHTYLQASVLLVITGVDYRTTCNAVMLFPCWNKGPLETMRPITDILTKNRCGKPEHAHISYVSDRYFHDTWEWSLTIVFIFNDSPHLVKKTTLRHF